MKKCPFCAEDIQNEAIKCKHCGEFLLGRVPKSTVKIPWYTRTPFIVMVVCCAGPLGIPLIWLHPRASKSAKVVWTIVILLFTWLLWEVGKRSIVTLEQYYDLMDSL